MSIYLGFDLQSMLVSLKKYCEKVSLTMSDDEWCLYVYSDHHGEFEETGSLFRIVTQAFKPFVEQAKSDREKAKELLDRIVLNKE